LQVETTGTNTTAVVFYIETMPPKMLDILYQFLHSSIKT